MSIDQIEGAATEALGRIEDAGGGLIGDVDLQVRGKLHEALGSAQAAYGRVAETANGAYGRLADRAQGARGELEGFINEQPLLATSIALGVGLAIGLLVLGASRARA